MRAIVLRTVAFFVILALVFGFYRLITIGTWPAKPFFEDLESPLNIAHRGGAALGPENTFAAFDVGLAAGADILELDLRRTRDGVLVVIHDATVDRTTDGQGAVRELTLAEIKELDAGYTFSPDGGQTYPYRGQAITIPTLRETLERYPDTRFLIELKEGDNALLRVLNDLINELDVYDSVLVASFQDEVIQQFRQVAPNVATIAAADETRVFYVIQRLRLHRFHRPVADVYAIPSQPDTMEMASAQFVSAAQEMGQRVFVWTINDPEVMRTLLGLGVDGIITDHPDLLHQIIQEKTQ